MNLERAVAFHGVIVVSLADFVGIPMLHLNRDFYIFFFGQRLRYGSVGLFPAAPAV
jgi:hypothetical protein